MPHLENELYSSHSATAQLASFNPPGHEKVNVTTTSEGGIPLSLVVAPNPANVCSKFTTYEAEAHKQQSESNEVLSGVADNGKTASDGLFYRLLDERVSKVENNYMTINPYLFHQNIYRKLHACEGFNVSAIYDNKTQSSNPNSKKCTVGVAHEMSALEGSRDFDAKAKKHCRFTIQRDPKPTSIFGKSSDSTPSIGMPGV